MNLVVAVDNQWGIGRQDQLLFRISEDMKRFRALTSGHIVILGRKTLQTFPGGRPLAQRTNIIMTRQQDFSVNSAFPCHSLPELTQLLQKWPDESIYVIGGASIYNLLLPYCRYAYVTKIDQIGMADCFFPNLDQNPGWQLVESECQPAAHGVSLATGADILLNYSFCLYRQINPLQLSPAACFGKEATGFDAGSLEIG